MDAREKCAKCGACVPVCPVYQVTGRESLAARGKLHLLSRLEPAHASLKYADILSQCLLCGACSASCPRSIDITGQITKARTKLPLRRRPGLLTKYIARRALVRPGLFRRLQTAGSALRAVGKQLPAESGLRLKLSLLGQLDRLEIPARKSFMESRRRRGATGPSPLFAYFPGCLANHLFPQIGSATEQLAEKIRGSHLAVPAGQSCCGLAALSAGNTLEARQLAKKNITAFKDGNEPILCSCASCYSHLLSYPDLLSDDSRWHRQAVAFAERVREFSSFLAEPGVLPASPAESCGSGRRVVYHDPCHLRFSHTVTKPPRRLIKTLPHVELLELPHGPRCCGQGGLFHVTHPELARTIRDRLLDDFHSLTADTVLTTCSGCLLQWQDGLAATQSSANAQHLAVFLAGFF